MPDISEYETIARNARIKATLAMESTYPGSPVKAKEWLEVAEVAERAVAEIRSVREPVSVECPTCGEVVR